MSTPNRKRLRRWRIASAALVVWGFIVCVGVGIFTPHVHAYIVGPIWLCAGLYVGWSIREWCWIP